MKQTRQKKIFFIIAIAAFIILLFNTSVVFAEINTDYSGTDTVTDENLDESFESSSLLGMLAKLIYAVGRFLEWILGTIFKLLTGSSDFPWADKIVFNAVPLLDINFINPGGIVNGVDYTPNTFVGQEAIQDVLKNLYATILTLAAAFFGIVVLITSIKLVISTIASDKAKYKQAIVDWLVGFVMLFCIHYAISFIFYLNEQLVTVASKIVTQQLEKAEYTTVSIQTDSLVQELIDNARASGAKYKGELVADILARNPRIVSTWLNACKSDDTSKGIQEGLMKDVEWWTFGNDVAISNQDIYVNVGRVIWWAEQENISVEDLNKIKVKAYEIAAYTYKPGEGKTESCLTDCAFNIGIFKDGSKLEGYVQNKWPTYSVDEIDTDMKEQACTDLCKDDDVDAYVDTGARQYDQALSTQDLKIIFKEQYSEFIDELKGTNALEYMYYGTLSSDGKYVIAEQRKEDNYAARYDTITTDTISSNTFLLTAGIEKVFPSGHVAHTNDSVFYWSDFLKDLTNLKKSSNTSSGEYVEGSGQAIRIISDLASYFRYNAYSKELRTTNVAGMKNGDSIRIQNMIMYAILVGQSLILFIAYVKRLFYVILLAMMAPIVVVFDFFQKFGK